MIHKLYDAVEKFEKAYLKYASTFLTSNKIQQKEAKLEIEWVIADIRLSWSDEEAKILDVLFMSECSNIIENSNYKLGNLPNKSETAKPLK